MYKRILMLFVAFAITGMFFISCSDDSSTDSTPDAKCKILSPNGGEVLQMGELVTIKFKNELTEAVSINLYKGETFVDVIEPALDGVDSVIWAIPTTYDEGLDYRLKIESTEDSTVFDFSDANFIIARVGNYIIVTSPSDGDIMLKGTTTTIKWVTNIVGGTVRIDLYKNKAPHTVLYNSQANDNGQSWIIPGTLDDAADYSVQVQSIENPAVYDANDNFFCLATDDDSENIIGDWNATGIWAKWSTVWQFSANGTWTNAFNESGTWKMTGNGLKWNYNTSDYFYIGIVDDNNMSGTMPAFSLGGLTGTWHAERVIPELLTPNGGEVWMRGTTKTITWTPGIYGNVVLSLADSTGVIQNIATVADSLGTYDWAIPTSINPGAAYRIKIAKAINLNAEDESENYFCISNTTDVSTLILGEWEVNYDWSKGLMNLYFVNDGTWYNTVNGSYTGTWTSAGNGLRIVPDYSNWIYIGNVNGDKMSGSTMQPPSSTGVWDAQRLLDVIYPAGGEFLQAGTQYSITWSDNLTSDYVKIDLYENDTFLRAITASTINDNDYPWTIPSDLKTSTKYKIRITSTTSDIYDESDAYFTVNGVPATPAIEDETFDDGIAQNWTVVDGTWTLVDSLYQAERGTISPSSAYFNTAMTGNYMVETRSRKVSGNNYYALMLNGDHTTAIAANGYVWNSLQFMIDADDGTYWLAYSNASGWYGIINTTSSAINVGLGAWNTLKVIVNNSTNEYHLFINDEYIGTRIDTRYNQGEIGLLDWSTVASESEFDYVKISPVNKGAMDGIKIKHLEAQEPIELGIKK